MIWFVGCPRSGTGYISQLMKNCGVDIGHEVIGKDGVSSAFHGLVDTKIFWLSEKIPNVNYKYILLQVRHPLNVIASMTTLYDVAFDYLKTLCGETVNPKDKIHKCMYYWLEFNQRYEVIADYIYRVEDLPNRLKNIFMVIHKNAPEFFKVPCEKVNSRKHIKLSWNDLRERDEKLADAIMKKAYEYGYEL